MLRAVETFYQGQFSTVKSRRPERAPLSPIVHTGLRRRRSLVKGGPSDWVLFATRNGKPLSDGNLLKRLIYPALDRNFEL